jgi:mono/diheme cytochrome c family protein
MRVLLVLCFLPVLAFAEESGEQVYQRVCVACHGAKFDKAPQLGDRKAWAPLIREGQHKVTAHAWVGVRNMPPRGGDATLDLAAFARAAAYMARAAGGTWRDPDAKLMARIASEVKKHRERGHEGH